MPRRRWQVAPGDGAARAAAPVTRLNRRTLAILTGDLSVAVLGATIWSLQPHRRGAGEQTELYNVDRVSKSEGAACLPTIQAVGEGAGTGATAAR